MISAFGVDHGGSVLVAKADDRTRHLTQDALAAGAVAGGAHYAEKASAKAPKRNAIKAASAMLRANPKAARRAATRAVAAHKLRPIAHGTKYGAAALAAGLGAAAAHSHTTSHNARPKEAPEFGSKRKGRYAS